MGMYADLIAIGPYGAAIRDCLSYPATRYAGTRDGVATIVELFGIIEGTGAGSDFARLLGITDPWDFNQHKLDPSKADLDGLRALFATLGDGDDYLRDLERFIGLRAHGFDFYFRPNG